MKKNVALIFVSHLILCTIMDAQENMEPKVTEIWGPQPEVIGPGSGQKPPSDAIVLFDGNDLSEWENEEGGPAGWNVQDGYFTIPKDHFHQIKQ